MNSVTGLWIDKNILSDKGLNFCEKIVYAIIFSLSKENGYCYCTNDYISNIISVSTGRVGKCIGTLENKKYIEITKEKNTRILTPKKHF